MKKGVWFGFWLVALSGIFPCSSLADHGVDRQVAVAEEEKPRGTERLLTGLFIRYQKALDEKDRDERLKIIAEMSTYDWGSVSTRVLLNSVIEKKITPDTAAALLQNGLLGVWNPRELTGAVLLWMYEAADGTREYSRNVSHLAFGLSLAISLDRNPDNDVLRSKEMLLSAFHRLYENRDLKSSWRTVKTLPHDYLYYAALLGDIRAYRKAKEMVTAFLDDPRANAKYEGAYWARSALRAFKTEDRTLLAEQRGLLKKLEENAQYINVR
jgi:hypothetical protein